MDDIFFCQEDSYEVVEELTLYFDEPVKKPAEHKSEKKSRKRPRLVEITEDVVDEITSSPKTKKKKADGAGDSAAVQGPSIDDEELSNFVLALPPTPPKKRKSEKKSLNQDENDENKENVPPDFDPMMPWVGDDNASFDLFDDDIEVAAEALENGEGLAADYAQNSSNFRTPTNNEYEDDEAEAAVPVDNSQLLYTGNGESVFDISDFTPDLLNLSVDDVLSGISPLNQTTTSEGSQQSVVIVYPDSDAEKRSSQTQPRPVNNHDDVAIVPKVRRHLSFEDPSNTEE